VNGKKAKQIRKELRMSGNCSIPLKDVPILGQPQPGYQVAIQFNLQGTVMGVYGPQGMSLSAMLNHVLAGAQALTIEMLKKEQQEQSRIVVPEMTVLPMKN
jgi:hypothetical protein